MAILFCIYALLYVCSSKGILIPPKDISVSAVFAFGDSYVDQGNNNYIVTLGKCNFPPYGKDFVGGKPTGRFSNGKTLADFLAEALGVKDYLPAYLDPLIQDQDLLTGVSFASGGSGYDPITPKIASAIPLSVQIEKFKQYTEKLKMNIGEEVAKDIIKNSVFLVVASTNDLLYSLPARSLEYDAISYDNMLVKLALNFVKEIHKLGAGRIAVFSAPPVGCLPALRTLAGSPLRKCVDRENKAAQLFNNMLKQKLQSLTSSFAPSRVAFVDFYNPLISIIENPYQYGLEVTDKGCCGTGEIEVVFLCNKLSPTCSNDSKFLFWDSIHLSEKGCSIFLDQILPNLIKSLF
ncbi:GDSL-like Lipase/Acylhydrolase superfamily protein [Artemisia annua]|uniref:GDSL-like Lipase/Acylhydrolase superfamily protein n=1 Tax=Artemisia annua TaxID=35608 RepID=A0A2U1M0Z3_ARTAN|nr:GDSL-like Lipase/Acylhydrolase superfamily protein [Artemisia annua]